MKISSRPLRNYLILMLSLSMVYSIIGSDYNNALNRETLFSNGQVSDSLIQIHHSFRENLSDTPGWNNEQASSEVSTPIEYYNLPAIASDFHDEYDSPTVGNDRVVSADEYSNASVYLDSSNMNRESIGNGVVRTASISPNIIVIQTDDQHWNTIQFMPTVSNRLAGEGGIKFNNAFVTTSLCCPSRASFLTGQYAHNHGLWSNTPPEGGAPSFNDTATLATWLEDAGYDTALIGKYLNLYGEISDHIPPGWNEWFAMWEGGYNGYRMNENGVTVSHSSTVESLYSTDHLKDHALNFIREAERPFFLYFTPFAPHANAGSSSYPYPIPASRHAGTCDGLPAYRPPSFNEADVMDKPQWNRLPLMDSNAITDVDKFRREQICSLKAVDKAIGDLMDALGPELDNTIIIFTSDNGIMWGEHRIKKEKFCMYEECVRVPLIVFYPNLISGKHELNNLVLNIDLTATIIDLAEAQPTHSIDGMSLVPLMLDSNSPWREAMLFEQIRTYTTGKIHSSAVRTPDYVYIKHVNIETGLLAARELYNLKSDPYQLDNIVNGPSYQVIVSDLDDRLSSLLSGGTNNYPLATDYFVSTDQDVPLEISLDATDPDGDSLAFAITQQPSHGTLSGILPNLTYTPPQDYVGTDYLIYKASDGQLFDMALVSITIRPSVALQFETTYGGSSTEEAYGVIQTTEGDYVAVGWTKSWTFGDRDAIIAKFSPAGTKIWSYHLGGPLIDQFFGIIETTEGDYVAVGRTESVGPISSISNLYAVKVSKDGNLIWQKAYGTNGWETAFSVLEEDDGYLLSGWTHGNLGGRVKNIDGLVLKIEKVSGHLLWTNVYGRYGMAATFPQWTDALFSVVKLPDGTGYVASGWLHADEPGDITSTTGYDLWLMKLDNEYNVVWSRTIGGTSNNEGGQYGINERIDVKVTSDGGYAIVGSTLSFGAGSRDIILVKTDENGNTQWAKALGGSAADGSFSLDAAPVSDVIVFGGYVGFDAVAARISTLDGSVEWGMKYGSATEYVYDIAKTDDEGYILAGWTSLKGSDFYLKKVDSAGLTGLPANLEVMDITKLIRNSVITTPVSSGVSLPEYTGGSSGST